MNQTATSTAGPRGSVEAGLRTARAHRVGVFCAVQSAADVAALATIPNEVREALVCVCALVDARALHTIAADHPNLDVLALAGSPGYGALQKAAFEHALRIGLDLVIVVPAGAPLAAGVLQTMLAPFQDVGVAAVFGSRLLPGSGATGRMPFLRGLANRVVSGIQRWQLRSAITDYHSGFRAYRSTALARLPFRHNGDSLQFDTELAIQLQWKGDRVVEVAVPRHSGGRVRGFAALRYAWQSIATVLRARANRVYLVYHPKFDVDDGTDYSFKEASTSVHQAVLRREWPSSISVLELGAGHGGVARALHARGTRVVAVDYARPDEAFPFPYLQHDLDQPFAERVCAELGGSGLGGPELGGKVDCVVALDVIEHLTRPELGLREIRDVLVPGGLLVASTGNIAFWAIRLMLAVGQFNYGKKGILDRTHTRLFSVRSFRRTIEGEGFRVRSIKGFGPPIEDMIGKSWPLRALDRIAAWSARVWPSMFAYQILVEADVGPRVVVEPGRASAPR